MAKRAKIAGGSVAGAVVGAGIGEKLVPVKYATTPDTSWSMSNADGTASHVNSAVEALNASGHYGAMAVGAGLGLLAGGIVTHRLIQNGTMGRQWGKGKK